MATGLGLDVEESWEKALRGETAIGRISGEVKSPVQAVGEVRAEDFWRLREVFPAEAMGERRTLFALWSAQKAIEDSGLSGGGSGFGVSMAAGLAVNRLQDVAGWVKDGNTFDYKRFAAEIAQVHPESIMRNNSHHAASLIAQKHSFGGPNCTITTACASATQAIGVAFRMIRRGDADVMAAGGADSMINPVGLVFFVLLGAACTAKEGLAEACRPFDRKRSGLVMGEGAGMVILEDESHARKRGARIYAEVAGYGSSLDAYQVTAPPPNGAGAVDAMRRALADSRLNPADVSYVNAHGTSTKLNDLAETVALKTVFGEHAYRLCVSSSKALIGHLLAASGGPELIFTTLSVARDVVHPTINLKNPDPKCDLDYVPNVMREITVRAALSNSFGFGGQNA
ncbi:MAG: beta-ketoacyl-[acyl-carrier-protein] synthase family protein, partial [Nitrospirae bacterium]|nr:beta-ketoacyl-[acyl-carrier-protein] synthase family protein [Nitrospirota bacterium]